MHFLPFCIFLFRHNIQAIKVDHEVFRSNGRDPSKRQSSIDYALGPTAPINE